MVLNLLLVVCGGNEHNYIGVYPRNLGATSTEALDKLLIISVL